MSKIDEIMGAIGRHGDDCIRDGDTASASFEALRELIAAALADAERKGAEVLRMSAMHKPDAAPQSVQRIMDAIAGCEASADELREMIAAALAEARHEGAVAMRDTIKHQAEINALYGVPAITLSTICESPWAKPVMEPRCPECDQRGWHKLSCSQRTDRAPQFPATRDAGGVVTVCQRPCRCGPDGRADPNGACPRR